MKTIIMSIVLASIFTASSAYALSYWTNEANANYSVLQNTFTDNENVKVSRFIDGKVTCYLADSHVGQSVATVSISCLK